MPVLINQETGQAEDLPQELAQQAVEAGSHHFPLNDPQGNPVVASPDSVNDLLSQGYSQPKPEQLQNLLDTAKYSQPSEQIKTGLEGAAEAATFGLSAGAEQALLGNAEEQRARREANPGVHALGQIGGLAASTLIPVAGAANLLSRAGEGAATALGLAEGTNLLSKVGSAAAKGAAETALITSGDEAAKAFQQDPDSSAQHAIANIGLSALLGAGISAPFGAVSPLWQAASETKLAKMLSAIKDKADGVEKSVLPGSVDHLAERAGMQISPEIQASLGDNPEARQMFQILQESTTKSGIEAQSSLQQFRQDANKALLSAVDKTPEEVDSLAHFSDYDAGDALKKSVQTEVKALTDPLIESFEKVKTKFKDVEIPTDVKADVSNKLGELAQQKEYGLIPGSPEQKLVNDAIEGISNSKSLESIRNLQSQIGDRAQAQQLWDAGRSIKKILRTAEEDLVESKIAGESPELLTEHRAARASYGSAMDTIEQLNDRLRVGKYSGPGSFLKNLTDMAPEDILRRLTPKNDAGLIDLLTERFPQTAQAIKDNYLSQILKTAGSKAPAGEAINSRALFTALDKMSPELRQFVLPEEKLGQIDAIRSLLDQVPSKMNTSGTAKTLDALWQKVPSGVLGAISMITGHNPLTGYLLGELGRYVGREVPDAIKLATLKFLGGGQPINSAAFKVAVETVSAAIKGDLIAGKAVKAIFKAGQDVLPQHLLPNDKTREKLDKKIVDLHADNSPLLDVGGHTGHYLPDHGAAMGSAAVRAVQYLQGLKPSTEKLGPLDPDRIPSQVEESRYSRALDVAQQPLVVMKSIKDGTLTQEDVETVHTIYPSLYDSLSQKITNAMIDHTSDGSSVPYQSRLSLSLFLGQALDSTMTPQSVMTSQQSQQQNVAPIVQQGGVEKKSKGSMASLSKLPGMSQTPDQASQMRRIAHS